jgi:hypothetical protein
MQSTQRSGPVNGQYTYSLRYSQTLLGGLLGSLLGVNAPITVTNTYPGSQWTSVSTPWRFTTTVAGLFPTCTAA